MRQGGLEQLQVDMHEEGHLPPLLKVFPLWHHVLISAEHATFWVLRKEVQIRLKCHMQAPLPPACHMSWWNYITCSMMASLSLVPVVHTIFGKAKLPDLLLCLEQLSRWISQNCCIWEGPEASPAHGHALCEKLLHAGRCRTARPAHRGCQG